jgi:predicted Zn-dependent peptidase
LEEEIQQVREQYENELKEKQKIPDHIMGEMLHETAWRGNTLGREFFATPAKLATVLFIHTAHIILL